MNYNFGIQSDASKRIFSVLFCLTNKYEDACFKITVQKL